VDKGDSASGSGGSTLPASRNIPGMLAREVDPVLSALRFFSLGLQPTNVSPEEERGLLPRDRDLVADLFLPLGS